MRRPVKPRHHQVSVDLDTATYDTLRRLQTLLKRSGLRGTVNETVRYALVQADLRIALAVTDPRALVEALAPQTAR